MFDVRTRPSLTAAEIAALGLSLAHLGAGPQSATARRALRHLFDDVEAPSEVVATTLATLTSPLDPATARRARFTASAKVRPRQVSLASIESKCGLISEPVNVVPPSTRTPAPPGER